LDGADHGTPFHEPFVFDPKVPASEQAAKERYLAHNQAVAEQLRARGLYPEGDVNAYLRTTAVEP
jgi:hypothetical protein